MSFRNPLGAPVATVSGHASQSPLSPLTAFYREELQKHWRCLEQQREYYSEKAIADMELAIARLMDDVDTLCARKNGEQLVSQVLHQIDGVTRLSAWSDPKKHH